MAETPRSLLEPGDHEDDQEAQASLVTETGNGPTVDDEEALIAALFGTKKEGQ